MSTDGKDRRTQIFIENFISSSQIWQLRISTLNSFGQLQAASQYHRKRKNIKDVQLCHVNGNNFNVFKNLEGLLDKFKITAFEKLCKIELY
jgi:hypothetical protein